MPDPPLLLRQGHGACIAGFPTPSETPTASHALTPSPVATPTHSRTDTGSAVSRTLTATAVLCDKGAEGAGIADAAPQEITLPTVGACSQAFALGPGSTFLVDRMLQVGANARCGGRVFPPPSLLRLHWGSFSSDCFWCADLPLVSGGRREFR